MSGVRYDNTKYIGIIFFKNHLWTLNIQLKIKICQNVCKTKTEFIQSLVYSFSLYVKKILVKLKNVFCKVMSKTNFLSKTSLSQNCYSTSSTRKKCKYKNTHDYKTNSFLASLKSKN